MNAPVWMRWVLGLAGAYNLLWGGFAVLMPELSFAWSGLRTPAHDGVPPAFYLPLWQCNGMLVGVYGFAYLHAATDPFRHWPIVLMGMLSKLFGSIVTVLWASRGELPWTAVYPNIPNDLVWLPFFTLILLGAWNARRPSSPLPSRPNLS